MVAIYDAYGEDGDFSYNGGSIGAGFQIVTTTGTFRSGYSRCAVQVSSNTPNLFLKRVWPATQVTGWHTCRVYMGITPGNAAQDTWGLIDGGGVLRIVIRPSSASGPGSTYNVYTVNAAGSHTLLGTTSTGFSSNPTTPDKFDCFFNYASSGTLTLYINGTQVFTYSGNLLTDSATSLGGAYYSQYQNSNVAGNISGSCCWSECFVSPNDTRNISVVTNVANAAGTLSQWTGSVSNVNQSAVNDSNFDTTATSANVQRYKIGATISGTPTVIGVVTALRATQGTGTLTHLKLASFVGATQYLSSQQTMTAAFGQYLFIQETNPATSAAWAVSDLTASARESGYQALT